jgi:hypothetical protein
VAGGERRIVDVAELSQTRQRDLDLILVVPAPPELAPQFHPGVRPPRQQSQPGV